MRNFAILLIIVLIDTEAWAVEDADVLFFAPWEDSANATLSAGDGRATLLGPKRFDEGIRGKALVIAPETILSYSFKDNCSADEGTLMMWVKPEWRSDDGRFHYLFRASTGTFRGKALNSLMLYKYRSMDKLMFYTSNGVKTAPHVGRGIAFREPLGWEPGQWHHVAATWSATVASTEQYLYIDGQRVGAVSGEVFVPDERPKRIEIGGRRGDAATWFDDLLVFSRPLLAREIESVYRAYRDGASNVPGELPFVSSGQLQLQAHVLFDPSVFVVEVDFRGARKQLQGGPSSVEVVVSKNDRQLTERKSSETGVGVSRIRFAYDEVGPGPCRLIASLRDGSGQLLRSGQLDYVVPTQPIWLGNDLGKTDQVLPPWPPLRVTGDSVYMWGREYQLDDTPLPAQVVSQGRPLLRSPVVMMIGSGGEKALLRFANAGAFSGSDAVVHRVYKSSTGQLTCRASCRVEFDGFMRVDLELIPAKSAEMDSLELVLPFSAQAGTLYHHANGTWTDLSDAGGTGAVGWRKTLPFVPYVWIGSEQRGLAWFCESNWNWSNADENRVLKIVHSDAGVDLRISFIDTKTTLTEPMRLTFGFMATPVKPMPDGWRDWRQAFISALRLERFAKRGWNAPGCRNIGVLWHNHVGRFSYLPADALQMQQKVQLLRDHDWETLLSYFALDYTQTETPDYEKMEREWRRHPYREGSFGDGTFGAVCNASNWSDFLVWAIDKTMDETGTDGVYFDLSYPDFCQSSAHGCGPGRYPLFATRELQKRVYALVKQKRGPAGFVYNHNSENHLMTTYSFADAVLNGEQFNRKDLGSLTLEKFRAQVSPQPYGVPTFLLPTLTKFQPGGKEKLPGPEFFAYPFLHDVVCLGSYLSAESRDVLQRMQQTLRDFGVAESEFVPYWDNASVVAVSPASTSVSAYLRKDEKAVLLVAATQTPSDATLRFRGRFASLRDLPARNPLSGERLQWTDGTLRWPLPDRSVQLAIVGVE